MATVDKSTSAEQERADGDEIIRLVSAGKRVSDPELRGRIKGRADRVRREMFDKQGATDLAVELIREAREE